MTTTVAETGVVFGYFEVGIALAVGIAIGLVWLINRRRPDGKQINVPPEVVAALLTGLGVSIVLAWNSGVIRSDPLLFLTAVVVVIGAVIGALTLRSLGRLRRQVSTVESRVGAQMAGLGNLQFYATKDETFAALRTETLTASEKLIATRFSPADISIESEYWSVVRQRAMDPSLLSIRVHSLAHHSSSALEGVCRLVADLRGATQFRLAVALYNNSFELILADDRECVFCFHDLEMTIRNGFSVDTNMPAGAQIVSNFGSTVRRMIDDCYLVVDFGRWVKTTDDVERLQAHLREVHTQYRKGQLPHRIEPAKTEDFLTELLGPH